MHPKGRSKRSPVRCKRCPGEIPVMWLLCAAKVPGHIAHSFEVNCYHRVLHYVALWSRPENMQELLKAIDDVVVGPQSSESRVLYVRNLYYKRSKWRSMIHPWSHGPVEVQRIQRIPRSPSQGLNLVHFRDVPQLHISWFWPHLTL